MTHLLFSTVDYTVAGSHNLNINGAEVHFIDVMLICDTNMTPWCNCTGKFKFKININKDYNTHKSGAHKIKNYGKRKRFVIKEN